MNTHRTELLARVFTLDGATFFITPDAHLDLLRYWRVDRVVAESRFPSHFDTELHKLGRALADTFGLTRSEWPGVLPTDYVHNPEPARKRNRITVQRLARAYGEATGHVIYMGRCYTDYGAAGIPPTHYAYAPHRCALLHSPEAERARNAAA